MQFLATIHKGQIIFCITWRSELGVALYGIIARMYTQANEISSIPDNPFCHLEIVRVIKRVTWFPIKSSCSRPNILAEEICKRTYEY